MEKILNRNLKVKVLHQFKYEIESSLNNWLKEHNEKISIIDIIPLSDKGQRSDNIYCVLIFYQINEITK